MLLLRHAALFSVHGFSSAAAAASGRSVKTEKTAESGDENAKALLVLDAV